MSSTMLSSSLAEAVPDGMEVDQYRMVLTDVTHKSWDRYNIGELIKELNAEPDAVAILHPEEIAQFVPWHAEYVWNLTADHRLIVVMTLKAKP